MAKGGQYERDLCRLLSLWWTDGRRDDCFWRTSQSGGRATTRSKKGKTTRGQCGDIAATDPVGFPLTETFTIESKRGYNKCDPMHLLDKAPRMAQQGFEAFLEQATAASEREGTPYWMIIHKKDHRLPLVYFPVAFLSEAGCPFYDVGVRFNYRVRLNGKVRWQRFHCSPLAKFLAFLEPGDVKYVHAQHRRER